MSGGDLSGVTISEVAAAAGVSRQTVSNVLKAPERVAAETAARVRRAIDDLGYRPNRAAQNLRQRASRCIGLKMVSPPGVSNLLDRFLHALTEAAGVAGYHMLLLAAVDEELETYEDLIRTGTVDGFVLFDVEVGDSRLSWFARRGIPFVCLAGRAGRDTSGSGGWTSTARTASHGRSTIWSRSAIAGSPTSAGRRAPGSATRGAPDGRGRRGATGWTSTTSPAPAPRPSPKRPRRPRGC